MKYQNGGQWVGFGEGDNQFREVTVDLDDCGDHFEGRFFAFERDTSLPSMTGYITTQNKSSSHEINVRLNAFDSSGLVSQKSLKYSEIWPETYHSNDATLKLEFSGNSLNIHWLSSDGRSGECNLAMCPIDKPSDYVSEEKVHTWGEFKKYISTINPAGLVFRGQNKPYRLRTTFHRSSRKDLVRYIHEDVHKAQKYLTPHIGQILNMGEPLHYAAFLNLLQHHGFPTPLLDWSYSPYIAAFFAFVDKADHENVRIILFDRGLWHQHMDAINLVTYTSANLTFLEPLPLANNRALPQQSLSSVTNQYDIESYVQFRENDNGNTYMKVIDIPAHQRKAALSDLRLMGITASSMFPGVDGICRDLKSQLFDD